MFDGTTSLGILKHEYLLTPDRKYSKAITHDRNIFSNILHTIIANNDLLSKHPMKSIKMEQHQHLYVCLNP